MHEEWYTPEQVAERLQVSTWTVKRWLRDGELTGVRVGPRGVWRVSASDIAAFLDEQRKNAAA